MELLEPRLVMANPAGVIPENAAPNIVLIQVDDMPANQLQYMPFLSGQLASVATQFSNSFVPTSLCGPSRASTLTGLYAHNTGVFGNNSPLGGQVNRDESSTIATWLKSAGYRTGLFGKYETIQESLESSTGLTPPPGWDEFHARIGGGFYGVRENINGVEVTNSLHPSEYSTDLWRDGAIDFIQQTPSDQPFFVYYTPFAPHAPYVPAERHLGAYDDVPPYRPESYNIVPPGDPQRPVLTLQEQADMDVQRHLQLASLLAIDEAIAKIYSSLETSGELSNTILVFTSDNGHMWGEHALGPKYAIENGVKHQFYEESIRVPLLIYDGRDPQARVSDQLVLNIDLAPTLADFASITPPSAVDGLSLTGAVRGDSTSLRDDFLLEDHWANDSVQFREGYGSQGYGIRSTLWKYIEYSGGQRELFDLMNDPSELENLAGNPAYVTIQQILAGRLQELLPADQEGPVIANAEAVLLLDELQTGTYFLRINAIQDDRGLGNSELRTGEYFIGELGADGQGFALDTVDGGWGTPFESVTAKVPLGRLKDMAAGTSQIWLHARDIHGNWGEAIAIPIALGPKPALTFGSDTGSSHTDGITVDDTPTFFGSASPGAAVHLVSISETGIYVTLGSTTADSLGKWSYTPKVPLGLQSIYSVARDQAGHLTLSAAAYLHVVGAIDATNSLQVRGTFEDDVLVAIASSSGGVSLKWNTVLAGTLFNPSSINVLALSGNDHVSVIGDVRSRINGGLGDDILRGGSANDVLDGGSGRNFLYGSKGNDRYLFKTISPQTRPYENVEDRIFELAGQGDDTLDFSFHTDPVQANIAGAIIANYNFRLTGQIKRVVSPNGNSRFFENVVGGRAADILIGKSNSLVTGGAGSDNSRADDPLSPLSSYFLRVFSASDVAGTGPVFFTLRATAGTLTLSTATPNGLVANDIEGNGTSFVRIRASAAQINATLASTNGLRFVVPVAAAGTRAIAASLYTDDESSPLERDVFHFTVE